MFFCHTVLNDPNLMGIIKGFLEEFCYIYVGGLSRHHRYMWKSTSPLTPTKTFKYLVTESRSRISEVVRAKKLEAENDGNLFITECMRSACRVGFKRGVVRVRKYCARKKMRLSSSRNLNMLDAAASSGNISLMRYLHEREFVPISKMTMVEAVNAKGVEGDRWSNSVKVVRWVMEKDEGCVPEEAEEEAAKIGNLPALRVFKYRPFSPGGFGSRVMAYSGLSGCVETVDFLRTEGGCSLNPIVLCMAAFNGHLELIQHLRWLGVSWDDRVCWMAAYKGHLNVLEWVRSQDPPCPWDSWTLSVAKQRKHAHVEEFCKSRGL